jgi:cell division protease FtsH
MSEQTARLVDEEVSRLLGDAHETATTILKKDRVLLDKLSAVLIEREVIEGSELRKYADGGAPIPTQHELAAEAHRKRSSNGHEETKEILTGPDLIGSVPPRLPGPPVDTPSRPD